MVVFGCSTEDRKAHKQTTNNDNKETMNKTTKQNNYYLWLQANKHKHFSILKEQEKQLMNQFFDLR